MLENQIIAEKAKCTHVPVDRVKRLRIVKTNNSYYITIDPEIARRCRKRFYLEIPDETLHPLCPVITSQLSVYLDPIDEEGYACARLAVNQTHECLSSRKKREDWKILRITVFQVELVLQSLDFQRVMKVMEGNVRYIGRDVYTTLGFLQRGNTLHDGF